MRLSLLVLTVVALTAAGCDSSGIDHDTPNTPGGTTPTPGTPPTPGTTPFSTFAPVDPMATYLLTDDETPAAVAFLLADYGLEPGDTACFEASGDYYPSAGVLASTTGGPVLTGAFSASSRLSGNADSQRIKDVLDGDWDLYTNPMLTTGAETNINEDFEATDDCWVVPVGATHVFFSAYDDLFLDNTDAKVDGRPFGVLVSRQ